MSSPQKLLTVLKCGQAWEAEIVRERLEAAGLIAFVQGGEAATILSYVGVALGGVRVQVPEDQVARARELLEADVRQRETAGPWKCPRCDEPNGAGFDFCYSCSMPRGETPATYEWDEEESDEGGGQVGLSPDNEDFLAPQDDLRRTVQAEPVDGGNPYQYLGRGISGEHSLEPGSLSDRKNSPARARHAGELVSQAMRWAVVGIFVPIPLLHLISLGVLTQAGSEGAWRIARLRRKAMLVLAIDLMLLLATSVIIFAMIF